MAEITKSIEVEVPVTVVYNQWTQFERFPQFMEGVKAVRQIDDRTLWWRAEVAGREVEWTAAITHQEPDRIIAWHSTSGENNAGVVTFEPLGPTRTRVSLKVEYQPEGALEKLGSAIGIVSARVEGDLGRFRDYIETLGIATGGWRGEIHGARIDPAAGGERAAGEDGARP
ncbi:MAG: SRPBCC family protein [Planctomycetota bacterium]